VTHHAAGSAGRYGVVTHPAPIDAEKYTVDVEALREDALRLRPKLITIGGSLNLFPHPLRQIRKVADEVGAYVLFDAAHLCGMIAGHAWQQPLEEGAQVMTMSTYKSLGGPPSGLIVTNDEELAKRIEAIAFPGLTANFDAAKSASLAMTLLDWKQFGREYAAEMGGYGARARRRTRQAGRPSLRAGPRHDKVAPVRHRGGALRGRPGSRKANILSCGIGLPISPVNDGLRMGTPEIVRWGMTAKDMPRLAQFIEEALERARPAGEVGQEVAEFRGRFSTLHFVRQ
jgi:glycine hydroxymethyltransferase